MKLNRTSLRKMILSEIKRAINEQGAVERHNTPRLDSLIFDMSKRIRSEMGDVPVQVDIPEDYMEMRMRVLVPTLNRRGVPVFRNNNLVFEPVERERLTPGSPASLFFRVRGLNPVNVVRSLDRAEQNILGYIDSISRYEWLQPRDADLEVGDEGYPGVINLLVGSHDLIPEDLLDLGPGRKLDIKNRYRVALGRYRPFTYLKDQYGIEDESEIDLRVASGTPEDMERLERSLQQDIWAHDQVEDLKAMLDAEEQD